MGTGQFKLRSYELIYVMVKRKGRFLSISVVVLNLPVDIDECQFPRYLDVSSTGYTFNQS